MSYVLVVDQQRKPLDPIHPGRARYLLTAGHAAVLRRYPFVIILKESQPDKEPAPLRVKLDPGSKTTGIALAHDASAQVVWAAELSHRGQHVKERLEHRRVCRRSRRQRHTRYRKPRFLQRSRKEGWLPPSLESRIENVRAWVQRLQRWSPVRACSKAPKETSVIGGFRTGDIVRAVVPEPSKKAGTYVGRIAIRATGSCNIKTISGTIQGIHVRYCQPLHRGDGYSYAKRSGASSPCLNAGGAAPIFR